MDKIKSRERGRGYHRDGSRNSDRNAASHNGKMDSGKSGSASTSHSSGADHSSNTTGSSATSSSAAAKARNTTEDMFGQYQNKPARSVNWLEGDRPRPEPDPHAERQRKALIQEIARKMAQEAEEAEEENSKKMEEGADALGGEKVLVCCCMCNHCTAVGHSSGQNIII